MNLTSIYHHEIPEFLVQFANTPAMLRLKQVGMHCGCEYTSFPIFKHLERYSRYDHSIGVALIIYHFTKDIKQSLAGLFHDIATPSFSHVIDFLNNDHLTQESTEDGTKEIIEQDTQIQKLLKLYQLTTEDVYDYHRYPIADNDTPKLSADRLEYTLNNMINFNCANMETVQAIYNDLLVTTNEFHEVELQFQNLELAKQFAFGSLFCSKIYVSDEDRYSMQHLAELLKNAIDNNILTTLDLYQDEPTVIQKLLKHPTFQKKWNHFQQLEMIDKQNYQQNDDYRMILAKKRYINPYIQNKGRITTIDSNYQKQLQEFLDYSFNYWICGRSL